MGPKQTQILTSQDGRVGPFAQHIIHTREKFLEFNFQLPLPYLQIVSFLWKAEDLIPWIPDRPIGI